MIPSTLRLAVQLQITYGVLGLSDQAPLPIGTFVRAEIEGQPAENVIMLPRAVMSNDQVVLVANERNELEIRKVEVLRAEPQWVYITSGVNSGEYVITTTLDAPIPGTSLAIVGQEAEAAARIAGSSGDVENQLGDGS